jgi:hypothetical protein
MICTRAVELKLTDEQVDQLDLLNKKVWATYHAGGRGSLLGQVFLFDDGQDDPIIEVRFMDEEATRAFNKLFKTLKVVA